MFSLNVGEPHATKGQPDVSKYRKLNCLSTIAIANIGDPGCTTAAIDEVNKKLHQILYPPEITKSCWHRMGENK